MLPKRNYRLFLTYQPEATSIRKLAIKVNLEF